VSNPKKLRGFIYGDAPRSDIPVGRFPGFVKSKTLSHLGGVRHVCVELDFRPLRPPVKSEWTLIMPANHKVELLPGDQVTMSYIGGSLFEFHEVGREVTKLEVIFSDEEDV
jgi:hypothetical protein